MRYVMLLAVALAFVVAGCGDRSIPQDVPEGSIFVDRQGNRLVRSGAVVVMLPDSMGNGEWVFNCGPGTWEGPGLFQRSFARFLETHPNLRVVDRFPAWQGERGRILAVSVLTEPR